MDAIRSAHAAGQSIREIATALRLSHQTIARWARDAGLTFESKGGRPSKAETVTPPRKPAPTKPAPRAKPKPAVAIPALTPPSSDDPLDVLRARHTQVRGAVEATYAHMIQGDFPVTTWEKLVKLEGDLVSRIVELTPAPPPDPATDPGNYEAAQRTTHLLQLLIQAAHVGS